MNVSDFEYQLPNELIAQEPLRIRDSSRLMVIDRQSGRIQHRLFRDLVKYVAAGDCLVLNDVKVLPARLHGRKLSGADVELLLLNQVTSNKWEVLVRPGRKLPPGCEVAFGQGLRARIEEWMENGRRLVSFWHQGDFKRTLNELGKVPLPPYIHKDIEDPARYQTVYAAGGAASAAPTAGLHFTPELLNQIAAKGAHYVKLSLNVGLDSFRPVAAACVEDHRMHGETFSIDTPAVRIINKTKATGRRIIAIGTTSVRVLETVAIPKNSSGCRGKSSVDEGTTGWEVKQAKTKTDLFIYPGYDFRITDALLTNFHLPRSTLLMLVCAFAGKELVLQAYQEAIDEKYRFLSFGDAMLVL